MICYDPEQDLTDPHSHAASVRRRGGNVRACVVLTGRWPYDCDAMRKRPTATVWICYTCNCWWEGKEAGA